MSDERLEGLVTAYAAAFDGWRALMDELSAEEWATPTGCPGWDAKDQLAHVVAVERVSLGDPQEPLELPDDLPYVRHEFGRFVEVGVQVRRPVPVADLVEEAIETFDRRLGQLRSLDPGWLDEQVDGPGPGMRMRGAQLLRTRVYDVTTHEYDVRRAVGLTDAPYGPHLAISAELIVRGWSKVLPGAVDGDAVLGVELDGTELARLHLGDGQLWRGDDGPAADAVLGVDAAGLLAIAGGRDDAPPLDVIEARGDRDVLRAVLHAGSITP